MTDTTFSPGAVGISEAEWETLSTGVRFVITSLYSEVQSLRRDVRELQARLNLNSKNSSKPPSSDPPGMERQVKKPSGKSSGGQPGHIGHHRALVPLDEVDTVLEHYPERCSNCNETFAATALKESQEPERRQVHELPPVKATVTEHRLHTACCTRCGTSTKAEFAPEIPTSSFGPHLQAVISLLSGRYRLSRNETRDFVENVLGVPISEGSIYAIERATSEALAGPYQEANTAVCTAPVRHLDETSWKQGRQRGWLWVAATTLATIFIVAGSRGRKVLHEAFGDALEVGVNVSDRWGGYKGFKMNRRQICHAHLLRDFIKIEERGGIAAVFGRAARLAQGDMFEVLDSFRAGTIDRAGLRLALKPIKKRLYLALQSGSKVTDKKAAGMCKDILRHWIAMWTFVRVEGVDPTNNAAERALRKAVLWRKGSFGTRSDGGSRFVERMLTITETCRRNKRDLVSYLTKVIEARMLDRPAPPLLEPLSA